MKNVKEQLQSQNINRTSLHSRTSSWKSLQYRSSHLTYSKVECLKSQSSLILSKKHLSQEILQMKMQTCLMLIGVKASQAQTIETKRITRSKKSQTTSFSGFQTRTLTLLWIFVGRTKANKWEAAAHTLCKKHQVKILWWMKVLSSTWAATYTTKGEKI